MDAGPRWCTADAPHWGPGETAGLIEGYADRHANIVRLGMLWGGLAHLPSTAAPHSPNLREGVDPRLQEYKILEVKWSNG